MYELACFVLFFFDRMSSLLEFHAYASLFRSLSLCVSCTHTHTRIHRHTHSLTLPHTHTHTHILSLLLECHTRRTLDFARNRHIHLIMSLFPLYYWPLFISFRHPFLQDRCTRRTVHFASNHHISRFISSNYRSLSIVS